MAHLAAKLNPCSSRRKATTACGQNSLPPARAFDYDRTMDTGTISMSAVPIPGESMDHSRPRSSFPTGISRTAAGCGDDRIIEACQTKRSARRPPKPSARSSNRLDLATEPRGSFAAHAIIDKAKNLPFGSAGVAAVAQLESQLAVQKRWIMARCWIRISLAANASGAEMAMAVTTVWHPILTRYRRNAGPKRKSTTVASAWSKYCASR
jgi:hypothetical protein